MKRDSDEFQRLPRAGRLSRTRPQATNRSRIDMRLTPDVPASPHPQDNPSAGKETDPSTDPRGCGCAVCELVNNPDVYCPLCGNDIVFHQLGNRIHCGNCFLYSEAAADLDGGRTHLPGPDRDARP